MREEKKAAPAAVAGPSEWPTNAMIEAGRKAAESHGPLLGNGQSLWHIFRDMLAAAPQPPSEQQAARRVQAANGKGWGGSDTSMIDGHAVSSESDCTPRIHSMSQYASKDDMLKAVMAENEQLRAQLAAAQQGVLLTNEQIESIEKQVWDLNHFDEIEREGNRKFAHLIAAATRAATQGLDAKDAARYRWLRRKVCIVGGKFHILNLDPRYIAPDAAIELDSAIDAAIAAQAKQGGAA